LGDTLRPVGVMYRAAPLDGLRRAE
jgi:hypothetical protein